jgi:glutaredoxin-dependent peroxiredoxin
VSQVLIEKFYGLHLKFSASSKIHFLFFSNFNLRRRYLFYSKNYKKMSLTIGQPAPEFNLQDTEKKKRSLSEFKGQNVVLLFFPLAFTSTCTTELCNVRDTLKQYEGLSAQPLGISVDSLFALGKFKEEQNLNFPLLSDFNKEASRAYGALYEDFFGMKGVSKRAAFVIDKEGIVQYAEVLEDAGELPNFETIKGKLRSGNE